MYGPSFKMGSTDIRSSSSKIRRKSNLKRRFSQLMCLRKHFLVRSLSAAPAPTSRDALCPNHRLHWRHVRRDVNWWCEIPHSVLLLSFVSATRGQPGWPKHFLCFAIVPIINLLSTCLHIVFSPFACLSALLRRFFPIALAFSVFCVLP